MSNNKDLLKEVNIDIVFFFLIIVKSLISFYIITEKKKSILNIPSITNKEANKLANRSVGLLEKKVVQMDLEETTIRVFNSLHSIEKELGYSRANIARCCKGEKKTCYGFKWKFL